MRYTKALKQVLMIRRNEKRRNERREWAEQARKK